MANISPAKVTYTGSTGPGIAVTATVINNVIDIEYDFVKNTVKVTTSDGVINYYDYSATTTVTHTISGGLTTIVIS